MNRTELKARLSSPRRIGENLGGWSEYDVVESEVKFRMEEGKDNLPEEIDPEDESAVRDWVCEDVDLISCAWDDMVEWMSNLITELEAKHPWPMAWLVDARNLGWRRTSGYNIFSFKDGQDLRNKVLPDCDCTFSFYKYGKDGVAINNFHHDSPTGREWYYLSPLKLCNTCGEHMLHDISAQIFLDAWGTCPWCLAEELTYDVWAYPDPSKSCTMHNVDMLKALSELTDDEQDCDLLGVLEDYGRDDFHSGIVPFVPYGEIDAAYAEIEAV